MTMRTVVGLVVVVGLGSVATASTDWCATGVLPRDPRPATAALAATLPDRAACAEGSVVCDLLASAVPADAPDATLAGVRYACVSDVTAGLPSDLVAALAGRLTTGRAAWWDGEALRVADDPGAVAAAAACVDGDGCADLRLPMAAGRDVGDAEWSRAGDVWVVVEPGEDGCAGVTLLPAATPGGPRAVVTATLGSRLP